MKNRRFITVTGVVTFLTLLNFATGIDLPYILRWLVQNLSSVSRSNMSLSSRYVQNAALLDGGDETSQTKVAKRTQLEAEAPGKQKMNYFNKETQRAIELIKQGKPEEANNLVSQLKEEIQTAKNQGSY